MRREASKPSARHRGLYAVVIAAVVVLMFGTTLGAAGLVRVPVGQDSPPRVAPSSASATVVPSFISCPANTWTICDVNIPPMTTCYLEATVALGLLGPGCGYNAANAAWQQFATSVELTDAKNFITFLGNGLNVTAASVANLNATAQELLTYFEGRAAALVPLFLSLPWNQTTYDQIAIDSGLVPAIEGMVMAFSSQEYQDWNATAHSWNNIFGTHGTWTTQFPTLLANYTGYAGPALDGKSTEIVTGASNLSVTNPWEIWTAATPTGFPAPTFFNMGINGTIICADIGGTTSYTCPTYRVYDFQQGTSFTVPAVSLTNWGNLTNIPNEQALNHISPFDLLKLTCVASCSNPLAWVETRNAFAFRNVSTANPDVLSGVTSQDPYSTVSPRTYMPLPDTMIPSLELLNNQSNQAVGAAWEPTNLFKLCLGLGGTQFTTTCGTPKTPGEGGATSLGSGAGSVVGGNNSVTRFATTFQSLVNNTLLTAQVYYDTLRAATDNGTMALPASCVIPFPSAGFPTAVQPGDYGLTLNDGLAAYWSYLVAVGSATPFGNTTVAGLTLCGNPHLSFEFKWSQSWSLLLNITASFYFGRNNGTSSAAVYANGTADPASTLSNSHTWPIQHVSPALLFPYEFQMDIPTNKVFALPINNPIAAILVNYSGNALYGSTMLKPTWGIPTYLQMFGYGNYSFISGALSTIPSGSNPATGDAINITSCKLPNGAQENPCVLQVNYFNNFTYGHVSALVGSIPPPSGFGVGAPFNLGGTACGTSGLTSWYDAWAGYVVSGVASVFVYAGDGASKIPVIGPAFSGFLTTLGCVLGWVALIIVIILILWVAVKVVAWLFELRARRR